MLALYGWDYRRVAWGFPTSVSHALIERLAFEPASMFRAHSTSMETFNWSTECDMLAHLVDKTTENTVMRGNLRVKRVTESMRFKRPNELPKRVEYRPASVGDMDLSRLVGFLSG